MNVAPDIQALEFDADNGLGESSRNGLIVLQADQTIEHEFAALPRRDGVTVYAVRIPNEMEVTRDTLRKMEADLPLTAELLPATFDFKVIGCCCTSDATMLAEARLDEISRGVHPRAKTSNPLTACKSALQALKRIALITPYASDISLSPFHDPDSKKMLEREGHLRASEAGNSTFPQAPVTGVQKQAEGPVK